LRAERTFLDLPPKKWTGLSRSTLGVGSGTPVRLGCRRFGRSPYTGARSVGGGRSPRR
jgi:hypothetical protein